jgi:hypothetical protein
VTDGLTADAFTAVFFSTFLDEVVFLFFLSFSACFFAFSACFLAFSASFFACALACSFCFFEPKVYLIVLSQFEHKYQ